jgi:Ca2+-binding EF-hand superfamily protein
VKVQSVDASLTNQIMTRDATNITDEQMDEFKASFNHFDKDKSGMLDQLEFRGCLLSLGTDIPTIATEGDDAKYEAIWQQVAGGGGGEAAGASFPAFVAFMAAERADAGTKDDLLEQFQILAGGAPFVTVGRPLARWLARWAARWCACSPVAWIARLVRSCGGSRSSGSDLDQYRAVPRHHSELQHPTQCFSCNIPPSVSAA